MSIIVTTMKQSLSILIFSIHGRSIIQFPILISSVFTFSDAPKEIIATKGMVVMACGVSTRWKKVLWFGYCGGSFCGKTMTEIILDISKRLMAMGITPIAIPSDSGACNQSV